MNMWYTQTYEEYFYLTGLLGRGDGKTVGARGCDNSIELAFSSHNRAGVYVNWQ